MLSVAHSTAGVFAGEVIGTVGWHEQDALVGNAQVLDSPA